MQQLAFLGYNKITNDIYHLVLKLLAALSVFIFSSQDFATFTF